MEDTYELDRLIGASPASASVLDIIAASATTAGAEDTSDDGLSIANHLCEGSLMDQAPSASFLGNRGRFPRVFGDEFGEEFGDKFGDDFSESLNLVMNLVENLATNLVIHQNW